MLVVPVTWEVEIGGLQFEASLGKKLVGTYLQNKLDLVAHTCGSPSWEVEVGDQSGQKHETLSEKQTKNAKGLG
jgi:hypothetical protein